MSDRDAPMLRIGGIAKDALPEAAAAIIEVATCSPHPEVAVKALEVLARVGEATNTTVQNCMFMPGQPPTGIDVKDTIPVAGDPWSSQGESGDDDD
jgi:hypothetical protein